MQKTSRVNQRDVRCLEPRGQPSFGCAGRISEDLGVIAPQSRGHCGRLRLLSSRKTLSPFGGCSPADCRALQRHRRSCSLPECPLCPRFPASLRPPKCQPSTHRSVSSQGLPSDETLPRCVHERTPPRLSLARSSLLSRLRAEMSTATQQTPLEPLPL